MGRCFLACGVVYWFVHLLLECLRIVLAWGRSHPVLCFEGSGLFLCPLEQGSCSSYKVHWRSYIVGFLLNWKACLYWHSHCSFGSSEYSCFHGIPSSLGMVGHESLYCWMITVWIAVGLFVPSDCLVVSGCCGAILGFWLLGWRSLLDLRRTLLGVLPLLAQSNSKLKERS